TVPASQTQAYVMIRGYQAATYTLTGPYMPPEGGGDPPPPPPGPVPETFNDSVAQGEQDHFGPFPVTVGSTFAASTTGSGDADLYVRFGAAPTTSSYACRPYLSGSAESCTLSVPSGQSQAYVMVRGYASAS